MSKRFAIEIPKEDSRKKASFDDLYAEARIKTLKKFIQYKQDNGSWKRKSQITSMDMIDIWQNVITDEDKNDPEWDDGVAPRIAITQEDLDFAAESFYNIIPPFNSGVIKVNKKRWFEFKVREINEEDKYYIVSINDYSFDSGMFVFEKSAQGCVSYMQSKNDPTRMEPSFVGVGSNLRMEMEYAIENGYLSDPGNDTEKKIFMNYIQELIKLEEDNKEEPNEEALFLMYKFTSCIIKTNRQLYLSKPKPMRSMPVNHVRYVDGEIDPKHKQIVRAIGDSGMFITSVKPPKLMNEEIIRHYHVACWNARGHVRHYKSGKTVYVKPSIRYRKCMQDKAQILPQTIIKVGG